MRTVAVTRIGDLRDLDPSTRGRVGVVDLPDRDVGPEDVRIRVAYAGICGSDPHVVEGFFGTEVPRGLGHEVSGVVVELGDRATRTGLRVGDRVGANFMRYCGTCDPCRDGRQQFCRHAREYSRPGMADSVVWHESQVFRLPDEVSLRAGALLEPTAVAVRIVDKMRLRVGDRVVICGGGPIGQLVLQLARLHGATSLTLLEPHAGRRELALRHGADHVIDPVGEHQAARADEITRGQGYDVVVDASGSTRAVAGLLGLATRGGTVVYGAMYPQDYELPLNLAEHLYLRELTLTGVFVSPYAFPRAVRLLPRLDTTAFTGAVFPLEQAEAAFAAHLSGEHLKVLIQPHPDHQPHPDKE